MPTERIWPAAIGRLDLTSPTSDTIQRDKKRPPDCSLKSLALGRDHEEATTNNERLVGCGAFARIYDKPTKWLPAPGLLPSVIVIVSAS